MFEVKLIGSTVIDWTSFLLTTNKVLGKRLSQILDDNRLPTNDHSAFLMCLNQAFSTESDNEILNDPKSLSDHIHLVFQVVCTTDFAFEIAQKTRLKFDFAQSIRKGFVYGIISTTLTDWRTAIINCSSIESSSDIRGFMNFCMKELEKIGLRNLFMKYDKINLADNTITLMLEK